MKVLAVTPWFPSDVRPGLGLFNLRDVELLSRNHEVTVLHLHDPALGGSAGEWEAAPGIRVVREFFHLSKPDSFSRTVRRLKELASENDLVHTMAFPAILPVQLARLKLPWVHTEHWSGLVIPPPTFRSKLAHAVLRGGLRKPDEVIAVGKTLADVIERVRGDRPEVIGNFVRFAPDGLTPQLAEARGDAPLKLIAVGGLVPWKGPMQAVQAVAALHAAGVSTSLKWIGTGPLAASVREKARELGMTDFVHLAGYVPPEALSAELLDAHVFVMPTAGETFGIAFAEALGHGLPVVTTGVGGHLEFLPAQASRVADRDSNSIASAVQDLSTDVNRWEPSRIIDYARGQFSDEVRSAGYLRAYANAEIRAQR